MKELIDRLSLGKTEYIKPALKLDREQINVKTAAGKSCRGSFDIVSGNGKSLKGIIFSTDSRFEVTNPQFQGERATISYTVNTGFVEDGERIEGKLNIISNGGEAVIPYTVEVDCVSAGTTAGNIKNLFHFANLVQMSYDEALKLFTSPVFPRVFLENDLKLTAVYNGLVGSRNVDIAMEEFLVAANKKKPVHISLAYEEKHYANIEENYGDILIISKDTWGYVDIEIRTEGDFIRPDKKRLTSQDFAGSNYELSYYIDRASLHRGKNMGAIYFTTAHQTLCFSITVDMSGSGEGAANKSSWEKSPERRALMEVVSGYLDFRMKKTDFESFSEKSELAISRARNVKDSILLKLMQANIFIGRNKKSDGEWLLENVTEEVHLKKDEEPELYCYYLYVQSMRKRDDEFTKDIIKKIRGFYESGVDDWRLLWMLFYIDEVYDSNLSLKLLRIKEQYINGMRSPLMYYEALLCLNEVPEMLRVLDDFEIQILNFGIKNDFISKRLAMQFSEVLRTERGFSHIVFNTAEKLYEKYKDDELLVNVISILIKSNKTDGIYFKWFAMGVEKELKITSLYEYYMYTIDNDYDKPLPQIIMMYFAYNHSALPDEKADLLYANIIKYSEQSKAVYSSYMPQMERYTVNNILAGRQNRNLSVIYKEVLSKAMVGTELAEILPDIISSYEVVCRRESMVKVLIVHKETEEISCYSLRKGRAYVRIFTEDAAVIFEDAKGNRYDTVEYEMNKLLDMEEYMRLCYEISSGNRKLLLYFGDKYLKYRREPEKSIDVLRYMLNLEGLVKAFRIQVEKEIIDYYSNNYDGESLDEYLLEAKAENLGTPARIKIIELSIIRGLYDRAYELMGKFGYEKTDPARVLKCTSKLIEAWDFKKSEQLIGMAAFAFDRGKYNEKTLDYLGQYYQSTTKELLAVWNAARDFQCESRELEEKIIVQMLFSGTYVGRIDEVYASYIQKGTNSKVRKAYLFSKSYDYFVKEEIVGESVFKYIDDALDNNDEVSDMCGLAYLKYMSEKKDIPPNRIDICKRLLYDLVRVGKSFEFFHIYRRYFRLPHAIEDKTIVEYRANPESRVFIHYIMDSAGEKEGDNAYEVAEMTPVCQGVFTYPFVIFYDESVLYYITEEAEGKVSVNESQSLKITDIDFSGDNTHYGRINDILVCRDMREEHTYENALKEYLMQRELMDYVFELKR